MAGRLVLFHLLDDIEDGENRSSHRRSPIFRREQNAFDLNDRDFVKLFRLNKELVLFLCEELRAELEPKTARGNALQIERKVLIALRFYATGSYQGAIAQDLHLSVSQPSVSRCIMEVTKAINKILFHKWVYFPHPREFPLIKKKFMEKSHFPGILGAIDCTHVAIIAPPTTHPFFKEYAYVNRKGYHSINIQLVCDAHLKILNVNSNFPGSLHDSFIWRASKLRDGFTNGNIDVRGKAWLIGDTGYPLEPWLLTPFSNVEAGSPEEKYNHCLGVARSCVERCIGLLKSRFRCLLRHRVLHCMPDVACNIINAYVVLHNMCIHYKIACPEEENLSIDDDNDNNSSLINIDSDFRSLYIEAQQLRQHVVQIHFCNI